jgi:tRNA dimethylallyltransferase
MSDKTCIIIAGPTAVGKTSLAINLAKHLNTRIISADSRQCYKELNIGVAKPSPEQLNEVEHYFINSHSIGEEVNASVFEIYALNAVEEIFKSNDFAIMAGGTGLYIKAFCEGMDEIPAIDIAVRNRIIGEYKEKGLPWLQQQVKDHDPLFYTTGEVLNPNRLMRALEVVLSTGRSIFSFHNNDKKTRDFRIIKIGIELPRQELYNNINTRVDEMMRQGLADEVRELLPFRQNNALQTVGYKELFEFLDGAVSETEAVNSIKMNTRHYAKRQMTWFKKDMAIRWFHPLDEHQILAGILS